MPRPNQKELCKILNLSFTVLNLRSVNFGVLLPIVQRHLVHNAKVTCDDGRVGYVSCIRHECQFLDENITFTWILLMHFVLEPVITCGRLQLQPIEMFN